MRNVLYNGEAARLEITGLTHDGRGVARLAGKACFIPRVLPGEIVEARIVRDKKSYARAELTALLQAAPGRVSTDCAHYDRCGGCAYRHADYATELKAKQEAVLNAMLRLGKLENPPLRDIIPSPLPDQYRTKVTWHVEGSRMGLIAPDHHRLTDITECKLLCPELARLSRSFRELLTTLPDFSGSVVLRHSDAGMSATVQANRDLTGDKKFFAAWQQAQPGLIYLQLQGGGVDWSWGKADLVQKVKGTPFHYAPESFFQVNPGAAEILCRVVAEALGDLSGQCLLDVYCGVGLFALELAGKARQTVGLEGSAAAVANARDNARRQGHSNAVFYTGNCDAATLEPIWQEHQPDAVVFDPPRSGLPAELITAVLAHAPRRIVYVSCDPGTLARDIRLFTAGNYQVQMIQPLDMFPRTYHVETVVALQLFTDTWK
jgi:23S rRNA (uracil1939-C5)-methyltransferase